MGWKKKEKELGKKAKPTMMIKMLPKLHISMPSRRDMKIPLHLIARQAPKDATTASSPTRSPAKLAFRAPDFIQHVAGMGVAFELALLRYRQMVQQMDPLGIDPLIPIGRVFPQQVPS